MQFLIALLFMCSFSFVSSAQSDGCGTLLTYEAGFRVGCSLVDGTDQSWFQNNLVRNTFNKYRSICPEYAHAVLDGYEACSPPPQPVGGLGGSVPNTNFDPDCFWNGTRWVCQ